MKNMPSSHYQYKLQSLQTRLIKNTNTFLRIILCITTFQEIKFLTKPECCKLDFAHVGNHISFLSLIVYIQAASPRIIQIYMAKNFHIR